MLVEAGDFSKRDFSEADDEVGAEVGAEAGDVAGAATAGGTSAFAALADFAEVGAAGAVTGSAAGAVASSSLMRSRRSRAPPGIVLFGSPNSPAGCDCLLILSTKGNGVFKIVIATHTATVRPTINPTITPVTVPPRCQRRSLALASFEVSVTFMGYIRAGAETPINSKPFFITCRVASNNDNRASLRDSSSTSTRSAL